MNDDENIKITFYVLQVTYYCFVSQHYVASHEKSHSDFNTGCQAIILIRTQILFNKCSWSEIDIFTEAISNKFNCIISFPLISKEFVANF